MPRFHLSCKAEPVTGGGGQGGKGHIFSTLTRSEQRERMSIFFSVARMLINNPAGTAEREEIENFSKASSPPPAERVKFLERGSGE